MSDAISPERRALLRRSVSISPIPEDLRALLDIADERDRLAAAVNALMSSATSRYGEYASLVAAVERVQALAAQYEADARSEGYGGELWSTTAKAIRQALDGTDQEDKQVAEVERVDKDPSQDPEPFLHGELILHGEPRILDVVQGYRIRYLPMTSEEGAYLVEAVDTAGNYVKEVSSWSNYEDAYDELGEILLKVQAKREILDGACLVCHMRGQHKMSCPEGGSGQLSLGAFRDSETGRFTFTGPAVTPYTTEDKD